MPTLIKRCNSLHFGGAGTEEDVAPLPIGAQNLDFGKQWVFCSITYGTVDNGMLMEMILMLMLILIRTM